MVYRLLGWVWWVEPIVRYRLLYVLVQELHLIVELVHRLRNILSFSEVGGIQKSRTISNLL